MNFQDSITNCFYNYGVINGRATRSEYWYWVLFVSLVSVFALIIDVSLLGSSIDDEFTPLNSIWSLVVFIPGITVTVRRLHDVNRSGWWILISFIPFVGSLIVLVLLIDKGTEGSNKFGNYPLKLKK